MKLTNDDVQAIVKSQMKTWALATLVATGYALFAKLIWTAKFPILIFLPFALMSFAFASINGIRATLAKFVEPVES